MPKAVAEKKIDKQQDKRIRKIERKLAADKPERKFSYYVTAGTMPSTGEVFNLYNQVSQGVAGNQRIGNQIRATRVDLKIYLKAQGNATGCQSLRVTIFQCDAYEDAAGTLPANSVLFQDASNQSLAYNSPINGDSIKKKLFKVLSDKYVNIGPTATSIGPDIGSMGINDSHHLNYTIRPSKRLAVLDYLGGATAPPVKHMLFVSIIPQFSGALVARIYSWNEWFEDP